MIARVVSLVVIVALAGCASAPRLGTWGAPWDSGLVWDVSKFEESAQEAP